MTDGMRQAGIGEMEINLSGTTLFMIMETAPKSDHDAALSRLPTMPRQAEWEPSVTKCQKTTPGATAEEKRKLMEKFLNWA